MKQRQKIDVWKIFGRSKIIRRGYRITYLAGVTVTYPDHVSTGCPSGCPFFCYLPMNKIASFGTKRGAKIGRKESLHVRDKGNLVLHCKRWIGSFKTVDPYNDRRRTCRSTGKVDTVRCFPWCFRRCRRYRPCHYPWTMKPCFRATYQTANRDGGFIDISTHWGEITLRCSFDIRYIANEKCLEYFGRSHGIQKVKGW
jgi:hypothetical protein